MSRPVILACALALAAGCVDSLDTTDPEPEVATTTAASTVSRVNVAGDVWHTTLSIRVGSGPNAVVRLHRVVRERAPGFPRPTVNGVMLMHGDFSSFTTNFLPSSGGGLALYLAQHGVDVWGYDRRWASAPADADLSDFGDMGLAQELDDTSTALVAARAVRLATGAGGGKLILTGFSRGGQLAYAYASLDAARPAIARQIKGLIPLDVSYEFAPEDAAMRENFCISAYYEGLDLAAGVVDSPNDFFATMGALAISAPDDVSPLFDSFTNSGLYLWVAGQTYNFFQPTPVYHLLSTVLDPDGNSIATRDTDYLTGATWFADAVPHQSLREPAESDALWCGEPPFAIDAPASRITVPVFYLGCAGGYGDHGLYSTTRVSSTDVTTLVIRRLPAAQEAEDFGHGDLLFAADAPTLAWDPLVSWIRSH